MHPRTICWAVAGAAFLCALGTTWAAGLALDTRSLAIWAACVAALAGLQAFYGFRKERVVADLFGTIGASICAVVMAGTLAVSGLAFRAPLVDGLLARLDAAAGLDAHAAVAAAAEWPALLPALRFAYMASSALIVLTIAALALLRRSEQAWRFCAVIALCALVCALLSSAFPAAGAFVGLGVPPELVARLPQGAGLYHMAVFEAYREGTARTVDVLGEGGVVTFPSFHTVLACATAEVWAGWRRYRVPVFAWTGLVLAATIVFGGHYFVDLLAGAGVFAAARLVVARLEAGTWRSPVRPSLAATASAA